MKHRFPALPLLALFVSLTSGCGPSAAAHDAITAERDSLTTEAQALREQLREAESRIAELENTPEQRLAKARLLEKSDTAAAEREFRDLVGAFPDSPEAGTARTQLAGLEERRAEARAEAERRQRLGWRAVRQVERVDVGHVVVAKNSVESTNEWRHNRYDRSWRYHEAARGNNWLVANVTVSSEEHDPQLPPIHVYRLAGGQLRLVGTMQYRFYQWGDYGDYLGNTHDYNNDFEHRRSVRFTAGLEVSESILADDVVMVLVGKEGCFRRARNALSRPEISYVKGSCRTARSTLTVEQAEADYGLISTYNQRLLN